ncbi:retropepsin-like aspartic protease [Xanthomonas graminis]|uniref:retropepsin-like aspartic protease n=1 Tax=Xanthomonas graminis TaxID=3390026 RepID=UPI0015866ACB|nr:retropepsin-like aspartic protease [Xanthomonas translucens]
MNPEKDSADAAMAMGEVATLDRLLNDATDPVRKELLSAYKSRTLFNINDSNRHADKCSKLALSNLEMYYKSHVRCKALRAGNALIEGDYPQWSRQLHAGLDDIDDFIRTMIHQEVPGKYTNNVSIFLPAAVSVPKIQWRSATYSRPAGDIHVQRIFKDKDSPENHAPPTREPFYVESKVNGTSAIFAIDTGGAATVIGGKTAKALGLVPPVQEGQVLYDLIFEGRQVKASFRTIESLRIGGFLVKNPTILISDDASVENVIGLDIIKQMGGLRFSSSELAFKDTKSCSGRLTLASDLVASNRFIVGTISIDGKPVSVDIDTGNWERLTVYDSDVSSMARPMSVNGLPPQPFRHVKKTSPIGATYNLGAGILEDFDMVVDLNSAKFCLEKKSEHSR